MPETPTSEGSIVAYLRVNDSDWNAKLDAAEQKARDLGRISPNIRVTADTADAIAKLDAARLAAERVGGNHVTTVTTVNESVNNATGSGQVAQAAATDAVTAANKRLEAAENAAGLAADRHALSIMRLNDALAKGNITETQRASLELTEASAQTRLAQAQDRVADAAAKVAAAESAAAAATDSQGAAADKAANGNKANLGYMGMIVAVVAALVPLMGSLAGYAVGVGGALGGMGAAGVLAVLGIKAAMTQGTAQGAEFRGGVDSLKAALDSLEQSSATAMLPWFNQAIQTINQALPDLNQEIAGFSNQLGQAGNAVLNGLVNAFRILNPLFTTAGDYITQIAEGFNRWTQDGGLQSFATFAENAFPKVADALGSVATLAMNIVTALAPIGPAVLTIITDVANALNGLPLPVLAGVALAAGAVFTAFQHWSTLQPIFDGVVTKLESVRAGATAVAGVKIAGWAAGAYAALTTLNTAVTNVALSFTPLSDEISRINQAVASGDVSKAAGDYKNVAAGLDTVQNHMGPLFTVSTAFVSWLHDHKLDFLTAGADGVITDQIDAVNRYKGAAKSAHEAAAAAAAQQETVEGQLTTALNNQTTAATFLNNAFKLLDGQNLSLAQAQTGQAAAFNTATAALQQNGTAIDGNSKNAVANQQAIQQAATAAQQLAAATTTATGSTDQGTQSFMASKTALEQQLQAQGLLTPAVQAYIDTLFQVPKELTTQLNVDNTRAMAAIAQAKAALDSIPRNATIDINGAVHINTAGVAAAGLKAYADGGTIGGGGTVVGPGTSTSDSLVARIANTEEIISNRFGQADRWRPLLKDINRNAGPEKILGQVMSIADVYPQQQTPRPVVQHVHHWHITTNNGEQLFQTFQAKVNALAGP